MHQVHVEVVEAGRPGHARCANGFVAIVDAPKRLQFGRLEALHANRQAIDARLPVRLELLLLERPWVGFQRDFNVRREGDALLHAAQQPAKGIGAEQARGAAAEEDRRNWPSLNRRQLLV
ncbi:hypothetical protein D3C79_815410 [compost metagenome]